MFFSRDRAENADEFSFNLLIVLCLCNFICESALKIITLFLIISFFVLSCVGLFLVQSLRLKNTIPLSMHFS